LPRERKEKKCQEKKGKKRGHLRTCVISHSEKLYGIVFYFIVVYCIRWEKFEYIENQMTDVRLYTYTTLE